MDLTPQAGYEIHRPTASAIIRERQDQRDPFSIERRDDSYKATRRREHHANTTLLPAPLRINPNQKTHGGGRPGRPRHNSDTIEYESGVGNGLTCRVNGQLGTKARGISSLDRTDVKAFVRAVIASI